jgi:lambda repressor-like predicted transcriptional regulator
MSQKKPKKRSWKMKRLFESNHLSQINLSNAYEKIIPKYRQVISPISIREHQSHMKPRLSEESPIR